MVLVRYLPGHRIRGVSEKLLKRSYLIISTNHSSARQVLIFKILFLEIQTFVVIGISMSLLKDLKFYSNKETG